jgi:hypothetical protein
VSTIITGGVPTSTGSTITGGILIPVATTVADLISQILRRLDEQSTSVPVHWSRAEILVFVNEALSELNLIACAFQDTKTVTVDSTHNVYDQPAGILAAIAIRAPNYLRRQTADDIDHEVKWDCATEQRLHARTWAPLGLNKFLVHPRPLSNVVAYVEGVIEHDAVADSATALPVRAEYESAIEDFCVERATFKEGPSELEQSGALYKSFLDKVQQLSGRNVIRMYPRYAAGDLADDNMRVKIESGDVPNGN